ncbi:MAG TPA: hypothetical protein VMD59_23690 [Acidimicrobiales bacterium]|nr:hypothetical protein [Acidimicrobiales bacterium]
MVAGGAQAGAAGARAAGAGAASALDAGAAGAEAAGEQAVDLDPLLEAIEHCYEQGWTDGLPVVPPTPALVERFLASTARDPGEVLARLGQFRRAATVRQVAVCAAMAGCRAEYLPVAIAAFEAAIDEGWPAAGAWQSTTGGGPLLVVNGPVRHELGFNSRGNVFGPGFRANATIGRMLRLVILDVFGVRPHELDQSTQGSPGKYSHCIAENEEESPFEPLHVELGYKAGQSAVAAVHVRGIEFVDNRHTSDPRHILNDIADTITRTGSILRLVKRCVVILGPEHARLVAEGGLSKQDVKEYLAEHALRRRSDLRRAGKDAVNEVPPEADVSTTSMHGMAAPSGLAEDDPIGGDDLVKVLASPADVLVVVAGAPNAGVSAVAQPLGFPPHFPGRALVRA